MRRKISIALTALLSAGLLAGCAGGSTPTSEPVNQPSENDDTQVVTEDVAEVEETTETEADPDETTPMVGMSRFFDYTGWSTDGSADWIALYEDFIAGPGTVAVGGDTPFLEPGDYTLSDMVEGIQASLEGEFIPSELLEIDYALIDCGKDGFPELALKLPFSDPEGVRETPTEYVIIRPFNGELSVVTIEESFYRSETVINEYGYIVNSGSNGASSHESTNYVITSDGEFYKLYTTYNYFGLEAPVFCREALSTSLQEILAPTEAESVGDYTLTAVIFDYESDYDPETEYEEYSDERCKNAYYAFRDGEGNDAEVDEAYAQLCADNGISILPISEIGDMIGEYVSQYGLTEEIIDGEEPDWSPLTAS